MSQTPASASDVLAGRANWSFDCGDWVSWLKLLPDQSVHCCVTSPPYWGLRDYGVDGQIGLEATPEKFVEQLVDGFREVWRVLRDDGTLWLNLGDSYCNTDKWGGGGKNVGKQVVSDDGSVPSWEAVRRKKNHIDGIKPKDLIGVPWMVAFAMRASGWYLRSDIIWRKPSAMPESVTDRPGKSHEYLFLLTKNQKYFYDAEAVKVPSVKGAAGSRFDKGKTGKTQGSKVQSGYRDTDTRNLRSVWSLSSESYKGAHFATFPTKLVTPCIKAGTSEKGCCPDCLAPWRRIVKKTRKSTRPGKDTKLNGVNLSELSGRGPDSNVVGYRDPQRHVTSSETTGWEPTCQCGRKEDETVPPIVLDPFGGAATTILTALRLGRRAISCDLNDKYVQMGRARVLKDMSLFT